MLSSGDPPPDVSKDVDPIASEGFDSQIDDSRHDASVALVAMAPLPLWHLKPSTKYGPIRGMLRRLCWFVVFATLAADVALAQDPIVIQGEVPTGDETHFFVAFDVPERIVEIEVQHDNLTEGNILDWGLDDPNGFRGWGGGNSQPAIVGVEAASRSYIPGPIPAGTWEVVIGKARIDEVPAEYEITILLRTEATLEPQPNDPYEDPGVLNPEAGWYAGDLHVHTRESGDSQALMEESLDYPRDVGLDFIMLSEHNTNSGLRYYVTLQPDYPDVLIVPGVEWTTYAGHANALGATEWVDHKTGVRGVTVEGAIEAYQEQGAFFYPTHPDEPDSVFCIGCEWGYEVDPATLDGVEVWSGIWKSIDFWETAAADGSHAVAIAGSDDHSAGQGNMVTGRPIGTPTVMVYAENLGVDAILEGVRAGRTVVKVNGIDDPMLETELSGERVGDTVFADTATLSATVTGGEGNTLLVIKNGSVIEYVAITSDPFIHQREVAAPAEGEDRYRHQVAPSRQGVDGTPSTIGSYVWLRAAGEAPEGGSSSGCSCRVASPGDRDLSALLLVGMAFGWWLLRRRASLSASARDA